MVDLKNLIEESPKDVKGMISTHIDRHKPHDCSDSMNALEVYAIQCHCFMYMLIKTLSESERRIRKQ